MAEVSRRVFLKVSSLASAIGAGVLAHHKPGHGPPTTTTTSTTTTTTTLPPPGGDANVYRDSYNW